MGSVHPSTPPNIIPAKVGQAHEEFLQYFAGVEGGTALTLEHSERLARPLALANQQICAKSPRVSGRLAASHM